MLQPLLSPRKLSKPGILRRIADLALDKVPDPRGRKGRRHPDFASFLTMLVLGLITGRKTRRDVSELSHQLPRQARSELGVPRAVSSTTLRDTLIRVDHEALRARLHAQVKAEARRGHLEPDDLPISAVAIDGKYTAPLDNWDHPAVQKVTHEDRPPHGQPRVLNASLISAPGRPSIDVSPIPAKTNEIGHMPAVLRDLFAVYGETNLIDLILADGGNSSAGISRQIDEAGRGYALRLTELQGGITTDALVALNGAPILAERTEYRDGGWVRYRLYRVKSHNQRADYGWGHLRQWIRIERTTSKGELGFRDWASNLTWNRLTDAQWLELLRRYWCVETSLHHTLDTVWNEDHSRHPWIEDGAGVIALMILRRIAFNLLGRLRLRSRNPQYRGRARTWRAFLKDCYLLIVAGIEVRVTI